jgi:ketosteroid isomerase-like protein
MRSIIAAAVVGLVLAGPQSAKAQNGPKVEQGVKAVVAELRRSWDARDIDAQMAQFASPEGLLIVGGVSHTLESLKASFQKAWADRTNESWTNERVQVIPLSDSAAVALVTYKGRYTLTATSVTWDVNAYSTFLMRRIGSAWKIVSYQNSGAGRQVPK